MSADSSMTDSSPKISRHDRVMSWYDWTDEQKARISSVEGNFEYICYEIHRWTYDQVIAKQVSPKEVRESAEIHEYVEHIISELEEIPEQQIEDTMSN